MAVKDVSFGGVDFQDANCIISKISQDDIPVRELRRYRISRNDGEIITDARYGGKRITLIGRITDTSPDTLETRLDAFRAKFAGRQSTASALLIDYLAASQRTYAAVVTSLVIDRRHGTTNSADFTMEFVCTTPFGRGASTTNLNVSAITANNTVHSVTYLGSAERQIPDDYQFTLNSFTGGSLNTVQFINNDTGKGIAISRLWLPGDIIKIYPTQLLVQNETGTPFEIDYSGTFLEFQPGARGLKVIDDFSARNYNLTSSYQPRYL